VTEVAFYFGAADRQAFVCRLLRKVVQAKHKILVLCPPDEAAALDQQLWGLSETEFITHCMADAPPSMRERSQVVFASSTDQVQHLAESAPSDLAPFQRVLEVVSAQGEDRIAARARWKHYLSQGHPITRHDLAAGGAGAA
jgi:DNA polymerase-3 subunit chi